MREPKSVMMMAVVVAIAAGTVGCNSGDEAPLAQRACERSDECNALAAGQSVDDCTADLQHYLDGLAPNIQKDTEKVVTDCLEYATCSVYLDCVGADVPAAPPPEQPPPVDPPPVDPPPMAQTGQFFFHWSIHQGGVARSCADVGASTVQLHSVLNGTEFRDIFDCSDFAGTTGQLPVGAYAVSITINDASGVELGRSESQQATILGGQVVTIVGVDWQVQ